jgi:trigger factor
MYKHKRNHEVEVTVNSLTDVSREVEITATIADLVPHFEKAYQEQRKKIDIRGFRKGKAPLDLIKKLYGDLIENEALNEIATALYRQAIKEKELKPIGDPVLVDMDYKPGESFRCKIQYDIRPAIELKNYKGVEVEKPIHTVTDNEVENELLRLRRSNATFEEVEKVTNEEHIVTADLQDVDDHGAPTAGKKNEGVRFYLADEQLEQPFKDALKAAEKGAVYPVTFEHQHGDHSHKVKTQATVQKIEKMILPVLDDAFVVKVTKDKIKTVDEFRSNIKTEMIAYWKSQSDRQVVNAVTAEILKRHEFQVPESMVHNVLEGLREELQNEQPSRKLPDDFDVEKFNEQNHEYATYQAKWALLREELLKAENITVSDEDLEKLATEEAERIKIPKDRLISYYKSSEQIKERLIGDKLLKVLVDSAKIKEVPEKI